MKNKMTYEILSMNELDCVSGGNNGEYKEIRGLLPKVTVERGGFDIDGAVRIEDEQYYMNPDEVRGWLKGKIGIDAKIDVGSALNPLSSAGKPNVYTRGGKSLTHSKVIAEIHNHFN